ncbi:MAG TPA: patatin-like phospholipase family protein [Stenotrophomonas sp.]|nr:patatin-like phospholipase family protein [Stenotrophomonas sp.]
MRVLTLDGGGAKGFYTLGVLSEVEAALGGPLYQHFDLIYGTSTGSIIGALLALGRSIPEIHDLYREHVPALMQKRLVSTRTAALEKLAAEVFGDATFEDMRTGVGIVAVRWLTERPMIFKANIGQAHGSRGSFVPGFGVKVSDAVRASCSAFPFFRRATIETAHRERVELLDGGYCANNPTLYAIADALGPMGVSPAQVRVLSIGVGVYPPKRRFTVELAKAIPFNSIALLQKTLEINTQSMDQLRSILYRDVQTVRVSETYEQPEMATDLLEHDLEKLNVLWQRGRASYAKYENPILDLLR